MAQIVEQLFTTFCDKGILQSELDGNGIFKEKTINANEIDKFEIHFGTNFLQT